MLKEYITSKLIMGTWNTVLKVSNLKEGKRGEKEHSKWDKVEILNKMIGVYLNIPVITLNINGVL